MQKKNDLLNFFEILTHIPFQRFREVLYHTNSIYTVL